MSTDEAILRTKWNNCVAESKLGLLFKGTASNFCSCTAATIKIRKVKMGLCLYFYSDQTSQTA